MHRCASEDNHLTRNPSTTADVTAHMWNRQSNAPMGLLNTAEVLAQLSLVDIAEILARLSHTIYMHQPSRKLAALQMVSGMRDDLLLARVRNTCTTLQHRTERQLVKRNKNASSLTKMRSSLAGTRSFLTRVQQVTFEGERVLRA